MTMLPMSGTNPLQQVLQQPMFAGLLAKIQKLNPQFAQNTPSAVPGYDSTATDYPTMDIPDSYNPNYGGAPTNTEQPTEPVPVEGNSGPSVAQSPTSESVTRKKRGLLGSIGHVLGSVFMPEPDSLYAAALRGGIWDAKANRDAYRYDENARELQNRAAEFKLQQLTTSGEFKVMGNNLVHIKPDGSTEIISPPATPGEKERLIGLWQTAPEGSPLKEMLARTILAGNSDAVLQSRERVAGTRAGATTEAARIRAANSGKGSAKAGTGAYEYKIINGKLMRRPK